MPSRFRVLPIRAVRGGIARLVDERGLYDRKALEGAVGEVGFDLFVVSSKLKYENNEDYYSYVLTCGCPEMLKYCGSQAYANRGILNVLLTRIPLLKIPVDIDYKNLENYGLTSVTSGAVRGWTVVLAVVLPVVTLGVGVFVVVRRKRH